MPPEAQDSRMDAPEPITDTATPEAAVNEAIPQAGERPMDLRANSTNVADYGFSSGDDILFYGDEDGSSGQAKIEAFDRSRSILAGNSVDDQSTQRQDGFLNLDRPQSSVFSDASVTDSEILFFGPDKSDRGKVQEEAPGETSETNGDLPNTDGDVPDTDGDVPNTDGDKFPDKPSMVKAEYRDLAREQQLEVRTVQVDGSIQYEFYTVIDGDEQVLLKTDQPPEKVEQQLEQAREDKISKLEQTYNVDIARNGETVKAKDGKEDLPVTTPTLGELSAVEQALLHSVPDTRTVSGDPLRIVIGDQAHEEKTNLGVFRGGEEVVMKYQNDLSYLKEVGIHEFSHVGQSHIEDKGEYDKYAEDLGWVKAGDEYLLKGKDDTYWKYDRDDDLWIRTNRDGNPVDSNGNRTGNPWNQFDRDKDKAETKTSEEMHNFAVVTPFKFYFVNPTEMGAELLTPFRDSKESRKELHGVSAESYQIAKDLDQDRINSEFGTQPDGKPKYIRSPEGLVVENTEENRREVAEFEATL